MKRILLILLIVTGARAQMIMHADFSGGAAPSSTLSNSLISFWKMDETSGTRYDAIGDNDLTDVNTVGYASGKSGSAADFEYSNQEYLIVNDNAQLSFNANENFTISLWVNLESTASYRPILAKTDGMNASDWEYDIYAGNSVPYFEVSDGSDWTSRSSGVTMSTATWYFICAWYNTTTDSIYIQINNGTPLRAVATHEPRDYSGAFRIGSWNGNTYYWDGLIDDVGVWGRAGNQTTGHAMADSIYNSGNGWRP
jgi:hypothetical protein